MSETLNIGTMVEHDGWTVDSTSRVPASRESIIAALTDTEQPSPAETAPPVDETPTQEALSETPADQTGEETETEAETAERLRDEQGKFRKRSSSERIAEEQAKIHAARRERGEEERRLASLRAEREAAERAAQEQKTRAEAQSAKPKWSDYEAQGKTWDEYQDDRDEWVAKQAEVRTRQTLDEERQTSAQRAEAAQRSAFERQVHEQHRARLEKLKADPQFTQIDAGLDSVPMIPFLKDAVLFHDKGDEILRWMGTHPEQGIALANLGHALDQEMMTAVRQSSAPAAVLSYFAEHPTEVERIHRLPPSTALVELGRLVARMEGANTGSPVPAPVSKAKPPIGHLGGSRAVAATAKSVDDLDFGPDYVRKMNEADARRRRL